MIKSATTTSEQLRIARSLLERNTGSSGGRATHGRVVRLTMNHTFRALARQAGVKESPLAYSTFTRAFQEISIARTDACANVNVTRDLISVRKLIRQFQENYQNNTGKGLHLLRSLIGKLLCFDSLRIEEEEALGLAPQDLPNVEPRRSPTLSPRLGLSSVHRARRQAGCPPRSDCNCPPKGILDDGILCTCQFFDCLDRGNVLSNVIFGLNNDECIIFVIDTTGSMTNEINLAKHLILQFARVEEEIGEYGCYILVPFNDVGPNNKIVAEESKTALKWRVCSALIYYIYILFFCFLGVGPITIAETGVIGDLQDFYKAVQALKAIGGHDAPEYSLYAMLKGLRANIKGNDYVYPGSQMVVITDATSKQPELKQEVIDEANSRSVCIHFFLSAGIGTNDDLYRDIAQATSGNLINEFSDWQLATFAQSYKDNPCRHVQQTKGKRQARRPISRCQSFNVSEFSIALQVSFQATRGGVITITRPNRTRVSVPVRQGKVGFHAEVNPTPGKWEACVNVGAIEVFPTTKLILNTIVIYINHLNNISISTPTTACKSIDSIKER